MAIGIPIMIALNKRLNFRKTDLTKTIPHFQSTIEMEGIFQGGFRCISPFQKPPNTSACPSNKSQKYVREGRIRSVHDGEQFLINKDQFGSIWNSSKC